MNNLGVMKKTLIVDGATFPEHSIKISRDPQGIFVSRRKATLIHSRKLYSSTLHSLKEIVLSNTIAYAYQWKISIE